MAQFLCTQDYIGDYDDVLFTRGNYYDIDESGNKGWYVSIDNNGNEITLGEKDIDMYFENKIHISTPKGEVKVLPFGSTILDFAYLIHSEIGNKCSGAEIQHRDGKKYFAYNISRKLIDGDQVKITTSPKQKPSKTWLKYVITPKAIKYINSEIGKGSYDIGDEFMCTNTISDMNSYGDIVTTYFTKGNVYKIIDKKKDSGYYLMNDEYEKYYIHVNSISQNFKLLEKDPEITFEKKITNMKPKKVIYSALKEKIENINSKHLKDLIRLNFDVYVNFENFLLDRLNQNESINRYSGIKDLVINEMIEFPIDKFRKKITNIINQNPQGDKFLDEIVYGVIDKIDERYSSDFLNDYGAMSRQELDTELDEAVENLDIRKIKEVRSYINEKYRFSSFASFVRENRNVSLKILKSLKKDESDKNYLRLVALLKKHREQCIICHGKGNIRIEEDGIKTERICDYCNGEGEITLPAKNGYLGFFTHLMFVKKVSFAAIHRLYYRLHKLKGILDELPQNVIDYTDIETLEDALNLIERDQKVMNILRRFPPTQKDLLMVNFNTKTKESLIKMHEYDEENKINLTTFFKKISAYKTRDSITKAINNLLSSVSNKEVFMDKIKDDSEAQLLFDSEDLTIIKHLSYDCTANLGKGTNWCIARDQDYWLDYVQEGDYCLVQFVDWTKQQTDPQSMIGAIFYGTYIGYANGAAHFKNDSYCEVAYIDKLLKKNDIDRETFNGMLKKSRPNRDYSSERESKNSGYSRY
jgi:hypothetical protein